MKRALSSFTLVLALLPTIAHSKCNQRIHILEGRVVDQSGQLAVGAWVGASWLVRNEPAGPVMAAADRSGRYRLEIPFRPDDDMPMSGAPCRRELGRVSIIAYHGDLRSAPLRVSVSKPQHRLPVLKLKEPNALDLD